MESDTEVLFTAQFLATLKSLVELHHSIYPNIPPQGIFFESLVEQAFRRAGWPASQVMLSKANAPQHDLLVGDRRISLKTETGIGTHPELVSITKLCTTDTGAWNSSALVEHTMQHLARYDHLLMLRAIWEKSALHYQLLEIPLRILMLIADVTVRPVGRRPGRQSLAADVCGTSGKLFRVHFDGADGKCQIRGLSVRACKILAEWEQPAAD
jgi:hypothetical protein